jgi:4-methyl-5(b-hydroxyethyl)-thiazole monophosphate biosynthesis
MEAIMIIDILRRAKANVVVASLEGTLEIVASRNVKMVADVLLGDALKQQYDLILLPVSSRYITFELLGTFSLFILWRTIC